MKKIFEVFWVDELEGESDIPYGTIVCERNEISSWELRPNGGNGELLYQAVIAVLSDECVYSLMERIDDQSIELQKMKAAKESIIDLANRAGEEGTISYETHLPDLRQSL